MDERIKFRIDYLLKTCKRPSPSDDPDTCCYALAVELLNAGGVAQVHNAVAVLNGAMESWDKRPEQASVLRIATWLTKQDPDNVVKRTRALQEGRNTDPLKQRIQDAINGKMQSLEWPWESFGNLTRSLMPGAITFIVGNPGTSKSFMLLQAILHWQKEGIRSCVMELEEDRGFWLNRALAIISGVGSCTDPSWMARYPEEAVRLFDDNKERLQECSENMSVAPAEGLSMDGLASWIEKQCQDGYRIVCCDPITAASVGNNKPWIAAEAFMLKAKQTIVKHGASLVMTTHPKKGGGNPNQKMSPDQDSMSGGAAFGRFASTVLWLEGTSQGEEEIVMDSDGHERPMLINRKVRILKTREGRGSGLTLGLNFDGVTLRLNEEGIVVKTKSNQARALKDVQHRAMIKDRAERAASQPKESEDLFNA